MFFPASFGWMHDKITLIINGIMYRGLMEPPGSLGTMILINLTFNNFVVKYF
jgi:hypothetical protein